ncbi:MAG TPA: AGE family epimerase/isomerase [Puia sp.]
MNPSTYRKEVENELYSILRYWMEYTPDARQGGFIGRVDELDLPDPEAVKGLVLNSRILWAFSAAYRATGLWIYKPMADRAYQYILDHFLDKEHGGAYWSLSPAGRPKETRKQIYGQAFAVYGLSEYYFATKEKTALEEAIGIFHKIEQHGFDPEEKGYWEAFARDWSPLEEVKLSEKEANDPKTANTNLHVLEAYATLYQAWPDPRLHHRILDLLEVFYCHIIGGTTCHLHLFFDGLWRARPGLISYGHDIEAAWLLHNAALTIGNSGWITKTSTLVPKMALAAAEGLDKDGGLWYEEENGHLIREKHWWPQAEAMVGFLQAWQLTKDESWWEKSVNSWNFIKDHIRNPAGKEWYWGVQPGHTPIPGRDKIGFWKCPYHNTRACLEIMRRLDNLA